MRLAKAAAVAQNNLPAALQRTVNFVPAAR